MTPLEEWLERNCQYVEAEAKKLPSGKDLRPFLSYIKADGDLVVVDLAAGFGDAAGKNLAMAWCRTKMREDRAQMYALVSAAWIVSRKDPTQAAEMERVVEEEGTGGRYRDERKECYSVSVGDREHSILAVLWVKRDYKQKIRALIRGPDSKHTDELRGRMTNLLRDVQ
jgi:hypothetical protein